jgi:hypothetical protein
MPGHCPPAPTHPSSLDCRRRSMSTHRRCSSGTSAPVRLNLCVLLRMTGQENLRVGLLHIQLSGVGNEPVATFRMFLPVSGLCIDPEKQRVSQILVGGGYRQGSGRANCFRDSDRSEKQYLRVNRRDGEDSDHHPLAKNTPHHGPPPVTHPRSLSGYKPATMVLPI